MKRNPLYYNLRAFPESAFRGEAREGFRSTPRKFARYRLDRPFSGKISRGPLPREHRIERWLPGYELVIEAIPPLPESYFNLIPSWDHGLWTAIFAVMEGGNVDPFANPNDATFYDQLHRLVAKQGNEDGISLDPLDYSSDITPSDLKEWVGLMKKFSSRSPFAQKMYEDLGSPFLKIAKAAERGGTGIIYAGLTGNDEQSTPFMMLHELGEHIVSGQRRGVWEELGIFKGSSSFLFAVIPNLRHIRGGVEEDYVGGHRLNDLQSDFFALWCINRHLSEKQVRFVLDIPKWNEEYKKVLRQQKRRRKDTRPDLTMHSRQHMLKLLNEEMARMLESVRGKIIFSAI